MPDDTAEENYELLPHKEIEDLKKELESLKEMDITPTKKLHISIIELNRNIGKLLDIFEEAIHEIKVEEGGLSFSDKIKPLATRLDKMEKNIEAIADVLSNVIAPSLSDLQEKSGGMSTKLPQTEHDIFSSSADLPPLPPPPR